MMWLLAAFRYVKTNLLLLLLSVLAAGWVTLKVSTSRNHKLKEKVKHFQIKEKANEVRASPVKHDKPAILDRM